MAECGSRSEMSLGWRAAPRKLDVVEATRWILRVVDVLGVPLVSLGTCHYLGAGQILTTTQFFSIKVQKVL